jgi:hypothetical protein
MRRALHLLLRRLAAEHGIALIVALGATVVLGATVTTAIAYTSSSFRQTSRSKGDQVALSLAEAGVNVALAQLHGSSTPGMADALPTESAPGERVVPGVGRMEWFGQLSNDVWTVVGIGYVANPSPGAPEIVRRASMRVRLGSATQGSGNNAVWNYVYADDPNACTTLMNSAEVNVPLYVRGSLCLENSSKVTGYALQVGGVVYVNGEKASVGTSAAPVVEAHIAGGCSFKNGAVHSPCTTADQVYATTLTDAPAGLTKPPVDFQYWYDNSAPGPKRGCSAGSIPGGFDSDLTWNRSRAAFDLTPSTAYDCRVYDANGSLVGQLTWQPGSPGTLTIAGTIFFDGDVTMGQFATAIYKGKATIYVAGRFSIGQQSSLCGIAGCTKDWKATENLLAIVAGYNPGDSVVIANYSTFQGAIYAVGDYREGNNSQAWGPIIANKIFLQNSTLNHYVPIGTLLPGMPATYEDAVTLTNEPGSWGS